MDRGDQADESGSTSATDSSHWLSWKLRLISSATLLSRVLGLVRDMAMASLFGAGPVMDVFSVAFRLPNLARRLFGEGAVTAAFLPIFVGDLERSKTAAARTATACAIALAGGLTAILILVELALAATWLAVPLSDNVRLLVGLTATLMPYLVLICVSALLCAMLHALGNFSAPAVSPIVLNIGWIAAVAVAPLLFESNTGAIYFVSGAIVAAGVGQLLIPLLALRWMHFHFHSEWRAARSRVRQVWRTMLPVIAGLALVQCNTILDSLLAWLLSLPEITAALFAADSPAVLRSGTAAALYFGQRLYQFPLGVFGVALGTVLFPLLSRHAQREDTQRFQNDLNLGIRWALAIGIPASIGLMLLADPITDLLFRRGSFTQADSALTAEMVVAYGAGVWGWIAVLVLNRGFYAVSDPKTPMRMTFIGVVTNTVLSLAFVFTIGASGLAWATSAGVAAQSLALAIAAHRRFGGLIERTVCVSLLKTLIATSLMAAACVISEGAIANGSSALARIANVLVPVAVATVVFFIAAYILKLTEPWALLGVQRRDDLPPNGMVRDRSAPDSHR